MTKRTFWTKLNHDEARLAIDMMDDAEIGRWFRGWLAGAGGKEYQDDRVRSWPVEMRTGFTAGRESFADAEKYSEKQRERVAKRYRGSTTVESGRTTVESGRENATENIPTNIQQLTANREQQTENNEQPLPPRGVGEVIDFWNMTVNGTNIPQARVTPTRSKMITARLKERGWLEDFRTAVAYLIASDWHRGANDRSWIADIDFVLRPGKATQLAEKANSNPPTNRPPQPPKPKWTGFTADYYADGPVVQKL